MDALERAQVCVRAYTERLNIKIEKDVPITSQETLDAMQAFAAVAQAEAMQRLAKRLEQWMDSQGVGFEMIEAAERGVYYAKENERLLQRIAQLEGEPNEVGY